jgi:phosphoribosylanthranilate isomerase
MTWIKICGTTNLEDALLAVDAGADALGFVFFETSPRHVTPEVARAVIDKLPEHVEKVGVFVNADVDQIEDIVSRCNLTAIQLYGRSSIASILHSWKNKPEAPKVIAARNFSELNGDAMWLDASCDTNAVRAPYAVLLDSGSSTIPGGTGRSFDWKAAASLRESSQQLRIIVAGGLNSSNVAESMRILNPWGVDVVSGVEASPGQKSPDRLRAFIGAVRQADKVKVENK